MSVQIYDVRHTESSEYDLEGIFRYIALELCEPVIADNLLTTLDDAIGKLCEMPQRHPLVSISEFRELGYRKMTVNEDYIVLYTVDEMRRMVYIERVTNTRCNWVRFLG